MLGCHKKRFLGEHLNLVLLFKGRESLIERKKQQEIVGNLLLPHPEGRGAEGAPL